MAAMIFCGKSSKLVYTCAMLLALLLSGAAQTQTSTQKTVNGHATGAFDVNLTQQPSETGDPILSRMVLSKQYHGDLTGSGGGQMLSAGPPAKGSGGYVSMEKVNATLAGRIGSFVLQHSGTMDHGKLDLRIHVVPDSGTGELVGLAGKVNIRIEAGGKHFYDFEYTLPD